jgi:hypothetical protein
MQAIRIASELAFLRSASGWRFHAASKAAFGHRLPDAPDRLARRPTNARSARHIVRNGSGADVIRGAISVMSWTASAAVDRRWVNPFRPGRP